MKQPLYLISSCSISPQHTYHAEQFLQPVMTSDNGMLNVVDADYAKYISPVAIRRMSRMLKIGITAGMACIEASGVASPNAIIIGTAHGSVTDMENFLKDMIRLEEQALNPTSFIQSTYNSVNGWIAMMTKCTGYNQTYVHRGFSFELTLLDAQMMLAEATEKQYILTGGFDELTPEYNTIHRKVNYFKHETFNSLSLFDHYDTPGSIAGEGANFFMLSNEPGNAACAIHTIKMLQKPTIEELIAGINEALAVNGLTNADIDVMMTGMNGDSRSKHLADTLLGSCTPNTTITTFKQLSGEYYTASGFGLWVCDHLFKTQRVPAEIVYKQGSATIIKNMLFCNVTVNGCVSVMVMRGC